MIKYLSKPILIWQMAKVGSTATTEIVRAFIKNTDYPIERDYMFHKRFGVHHVHYMRDLRKKWDVKIENYRTISMTRDLVGRNISHFFNTSANPDDKTGAHWNIGNKEDVLSKDLDYLLHFFYHEVSEENHLKASKWFDTEYLPEVGINVYDIPFDHMKGYKFMSPDRLIIRTEDLSVAGGDAISKMLGRKFNMSYRPKGFFPKIGANRWYGNIYKRFCDVPVPQKYVDMMYDCKTMRHFYTKEEIQSFKKKWTQSY